MVIVSAATLTVTTCRGVDAAQDDLLPGDHDHAGVAGPALGGARLSGWPRRRPGGAGATEHPDLVPGQRARPGAQQFPGARPKNISASCSIPDAD